MRSQYKVLAGAAVTALAMAAPAHAQLSVEAGDWTLSFDGNVNTFYTVTDCRDDNDVAGGLACTEGGSESTSDRHNIRTGLLPSKLGFSAETRQAGYDIQAYVSYWPGVNASDIGGRSTALGNNTVNFRQVFLTFGNETMGTVKLGRDLGIFGSDAILNDMTIMGVGSISDATINGGNTSLGRIGTGYIYADWKAQVSYATPDFNGFQVTAGLTEPFDPMTLDGVGGVGTGSEVGDNKFDRPAMELKATYDFAQQGIDGRVWVGGIRQEVNREGERDYTAQAFEIGARAAFGPVEGVAYYYNGKGIGTTVQLADGYSAANDSRRDSDGFYVQGMYTLPGVGTKLGVSYGESNLDDESGDPGTLVAEATFTEAENHDGDKNKERNYALGAILFF